MQAIERAVERHQNGDFISSTLSSSSYRGDMKTYHFAVDNSGRSGQRRCTPRHNQPQPSAQRPQHVPHPKSHQIPGRSLLGKRDKFNVHPDDVCRNSISHGTADIERHNLPDIPHRPAHPRSTLLLPEPVKDRARRRPWPRSVYRRDGDRTCPSPPSVRPAYHPPSTPRSSRSRLLDPRSLARAEQVEVRVGQLGDPPEHAQGTACPSRSRTTPGARP